MKRISFDTFEFDVSILVERKNGDNGEPLGLSREAILDFDKGLTDAFKQAMLDTLREGFNPRAVSIQGVIKVTGVKI